MEHKLVLVADGEVECCEKDFAESNYSKDKVASLENVCEMLQDHEGKITLSYYGSSIYEPIYVKATSMCDRCKWFILFNIVDKKN